MECEGDNHPILQNENIPDEDFYDDDDDTDDWVMMNDKGSFKQRLCKIITTRIKFNFVFCVLVHLKEYNLGMKGVIKYKKRDIISISRTGMLIMH